MPREKTEGKFAAPSGRERKRTKGGRYAAKPAPRSARRTPRAEEPAPRRTAPQEESAPRAVRPVPRAAEPAPRRVRPAPEPAPQQEQAAPRRPQKVKRKRRPGGFLLLLLPLAAVAATVYISLTMVDMGSTYTFEDSGVQYYAGAESPVLRGSQMKITDGLTMMVQNGQSGSTELPVYLENSRALVSSVDMLYYTPRSQQYTRLMHFSQVLCRDTGGIVVSRERDETVMESGFLHDGDDLYIFLEPMEVEFNGYIKQLPALSYVDADYGGYITVFDYGTKETFMEQSNGSGIARTLAGDYTISLLGDSMTYLDGTRRLLLSKPSIVDPLEFD